MKNIACEFGEEQRLKGVLSISTQEPREDFAMILVSAGFTAKSGPYRLYAELARSLTGLGIATLRFDLGGIGISQTLSPGMPLAIRTKQDIRHAADLLQEQYGFTKFVVGGLCSGAEDAFHYASGDARVQGVLLIDPHAYKTKMWGFRNNFSRRFLNRVVYKVLRVVKLIKIVDRETEDSSAGGLGGNLIEYRYTPHEKSAPIVKELLKRHVHLHYVYTGGRTDEFNHKRQFFKMFKGIDFGSYLTLDFIPRIEHIQEFEQDRNELVSVISRRMLATYKQT